MQSRTPAPQARRTVFLAGLLLALAGLLAYSNSLSGPLMFDDLSSIRENPSIKHGWLEALTPPAEGQTVMGRPLLNLSFAFNYWLGGLDPWGYHVVNLAIHLLSGLILFGLVRRTLERPVLRAKFGEASVLLAFAVALLWVVHPLQTGCVSYIAQRAESLVSLCYLLTLYFFIRGAESRHGWWLALSFGACLLGIFSKEVIATAPLLVFLYDRTFVAGTFKEAWRRRWKYYIALAGTWIPLGGLAMTTSMRVEAGMVQGGQLIGATGYSPGMIWWGYLLKQCEAVVLYLRLVFWPHPLILGYGSGLVTNPLDVAPQIFLLGLLIAATLWALVRRPALGFLGAWVFLILGPTSSVIPLLNDTMAERRMYLPLAAVLTLALLGLWSRFGRRSLWAVVVLALAAGGLTFERNEDYLSEVRMKRELMANIPAFYADTLLGMSMDVQGRKEAALAYFERAIQLNPAALDAHNNLATELVALGRGPEAEKEYLRTLQLHPAFAIVHYDYGVFLVNAGRPGEAVHELETALRLDANFAEAHLDYGVALLRLGHTPEALAQFKEGLRLKPDWALAHKDLGFALIGVGQADLALPHFREAVRLAPDDAEMHFLLGYTLLHFGELTLAEMEFRRALQLRPEYFEAENNLGSVLLAQNRIDEALAACAEAIKLQPGNAWGQFNYADVLSRAGRMPEAVAHYQEALRLKPDFAEARKNLDALNAALGGRN